MLNYFEKVVPDGYVCNMCGITNCRLWRRSRATLYRSILWCTTCLPHNEIAGRDAKFRNVKGLIYPVKGAFIPAIPIAQDTKQSERSSNFTDDMLEWWANLPEKPPPMKKKESWFDYYGRTVPENYVCNQCKQTDCRL